MDHAARGKQALQASKFEEAIEAYTAALKVSPTSPDYLIQRATAYHRAKNYPNALADANNAVLNAQKRAKKELIVEAQFRRGCAYYALERYGDAGLVFSVVKRMDGKHKQVDMYQGLAGNALKKLSGGDDSKGRCTVTETPDPDEIATPASGSSQPLPNNGSAKTSTTASPPAASQQTPVDQIRHEWYQNSENVYFTLLAKGVPKDKTTIDIHERSLSISFPLASGSSYDLSLDPLFDAVKPDKCIPRILTTKIEVVLAKATPGVKWSALESDRPIVKATSDAAATTASNGQAVNRAVYSTAKPTGPAYPTSSKSGPKDWDRIVKDHGTRVASNDSDDKVDAMDDDDDDFGGGDEANQFFKKLFKNASPETQRAMMKSYTESNGTALSTNWEEVSKGPVETLPPDGMEARKW